MSSLSNGSEYLVMLQYGPVKGLAGQGEGAFPITTHKQLGPYPFNLPISLLTNLSFMKNYVNCINK